MTQTAAATSPFKFKSYGDIVLALGVMAIMALMVLRLPTAVIDVLVAVNIACGVVLLLIALYVKHPVAFNSFPSVLLISTLFRLSLSVATTRLILLDGDAGHIIDAFGNFVAGGNLVVGIVVFIIITIVQFIVIAKGAERVAEVAARFTLDAMPGKQLSIDSDLRSGLIDKDEARRRRTLLEQESQLNGALDGAMKFVKGDAIASIVIVIVNLLGGLTIGVLQRGLPAGEAMQLYSILTIGDGMVAQIPALLSAMAAGLVVTRSASDGNDSHLGDTIGRQISAHPRALMMTSVISALLALVPGFPTLVFLGLALVAFVLARRAMAKAGKDDPHSTAGSGTATAFHQASRRTQDEQASIAQPLVVEIGASAKSVDVATLRRDLADAATKSATILGIRLPQPALIVSHDATAPGWRISIFDVPVASSAPSEAFKAEAVLQALEQVLSQQAERFVGVQEVSDLLDAAAEQYPALVKEVLRQISAQKVAEVLRLLLRESIPLRNLRDVLEALAEWGSKERDAAGLAEFVRIGLKRYMTSRYADANRHIAALVIDASVEDAIRRALTDTPAGVLLMLPPKRVAELRDGLSHQLARLGNTTHPVLVTNVDVRRHVRQALEAICPTITVLSYQELAPDVEVQPLGTVRFHSEERNAA